MRTVALAFALLASSALPGIASDPQGRFAIEGGGLQTCDAFLDSAQWRTGDLGGYGGWIEGYLTATSRHVDGIYDLTPWQTTESLLGLMRSVCRQMPGDTRFADALAELVALLRPQALDEESEVILIDVDEATTLPVYVTVLDRVGAALRDRGHAVSALPGHFGEDTRAALTLVQREAGLAETGVPDQRTLFVLLLDATPVDVAQ